MIDASNIHFDYRFKLQIPKIRPFSNLNGAKLANICLTIIFGIDFGYYRSKHKLKNIWQKNTFDLIFHLA